MALLHHYFYLRVSHGPITVCTSFVAHGSSNAISKTGKRAENFRRKWVMVNAKCVHPRLALPIDAP